MKDNKATVAGMMKEGYEAKVGLEALNRAGKCPQLKGIVHEVMFKDKFNVDPAHLLKGEQAVLTKSPTAQMKDIVVMKGNKVVGSMQLKDTVSNAGVRKTVEQIKNGHYNKTAVYGTKETAEKIAGRVSQKVHSTGISSETTKRIADKALGHMPTADALAGAAKSGGLFGGAVGAGIEAVSSLADVMDGEKDLDEAVVDVAAAGVKGAAVGAVGSTVGSLAAGAAGSAASAAAATGIGSTVAGTAIGGMAIAAAPVAAGLAAAALAGSLLTGDTLEDAADGFGDAVESTIDGIGDAAEGVCNVVEDVFDGVGDFLGDLFDW